MIYCSDRRLVTSLAARVLFCGAAARHADEPHRGVAGSVATFQNKTQLFVGRFCETPFASS
jgi:hypothetical protein